MSDNIDELRKYPLPILEKWIEEERRRIDETVNLTSEKNISELSEKVGMSLPPFHRKELHGKSAGPLYHVTGEFFSERGLHRKEDPMEDQVGLLHPVNDVRTDNLPQGDPIVYAHRKLSANSSILVGENCTIVHRELEFGSYLGGSSQAYTHLTLPKNYTVPAGARIMIFDIIDSLGSAWYSYTYIFKLGSLSFRLLLCERAFDDSNIFAVSLPLGITNVQFSYSGVPPQTLGGTAEAHFTT